MIIKENMQTWTEIIVNGETSCAMRVIKVMSQLGFGGGKSNESA